MRADAPRARGLAAPLILAVGAFLCYGGPVVRRLGFYHDDWPLIETMAFHGGGLWELVRFQFAHSAFLFRPGSVFCWTIPFLAFGASPVPWHLLAMAFTWALGLTVDGTLRDLGLPRRASLLAALLFMAFPNKDATLFWPATALTVTPSILFFLLAYRLHLRRVARGGAALLAASCLLLIMSLCIYEQTFFLLPLWLVVPGLVDEPAAARLRRGIGWGAAAVALFALYKFGVAPRLMPYNKTVVLSPKHALFVAYMSVRAFADPRWFVYLLQLAWAGVRWNPFVSLAAVLLPVWAWRATGDDEGAATAPRAVVLWGAGVFVLAYLPLCFSDYAPSAYDHMNRLNELPALGVAAALCGWAAASTGRARSVALALATSFCLLVSGAFAEVWAESYHRQLAVRDAVIGQPWPEGKTVLVVLPELYAARKAPVFLSGYDVSAAIHLWTGRLDRDAVTYTQWTRVTPDGIALIAKTIPYASTALLDMSDGVIRPLDYRAARALPPILETWDTPLHLWTPAAPR